MRVSVLELQRARKDLEAWCRRRNAVRPGVSGWCLSVQGETFVIFECADSTPVLRLCYADSGWRLFVPAGGGWQPYPARPEIATIAALVEELEQAPLHIHW
jgi:hypothetical protein